MAHWVFGVIGQHVLLAVVASELRRFGQVGVTWRENLVFDARVESEDGEFVLTLLVDGSSSLFALLDSPLRVGHRVFGFAHLDDGAAAVPAVGREILFPERVVDRERHVVEHGVRIADPVGRNSVDPFRRNKNDPCKAYVFQGLFCSFALPTLASG